MKYCVRMLDYREAEEGWGNTLQQAVADAEAKCVAWLQTRFKANIDRYLELGSERKAKRLPLWLEPPGYVSKQLRPDYAEPMQDPKIDLRIAEAAARSLNRRKRLSNKGGKPIRHPRGKGYDLILQLDAHSRHNPNDSTLAKLAGVTKQYVGKIRARTKYKQDLERIRTLVDSWRLIEALGRSDVEHSSFAIKNLRRLNAMSSPQLKRQILHWAHGEGHQYPIKSALDGKIYQTAQEYGLAVWRSIDEASKQSGSRTYPRELIFGPDEPVEE